MCFGFVFLLCESRTVCSSYNFNDLMYFFVIARFQGEFHEKTGQILIKSCKKRNLTTPTLDLMLIVCFCLNYDEFVSHVPFVGLNVPFKTKSTRVYYLCNCFFSQYSISVKKMYEITCMNLFWVKLRTLRSFIHLSVRS